MTDNMKDRFHPCFEIGLSTIVAISEDVAKIEEKTKKAIIKFQRGELIGFDTPEYIIDGIIEGLVAKGLTKYPKSGGADWFKDAVLSYLKEKGINDLTRDNIVCVNGGQQGLELSFKLPEKRKALGFSPYWPCLTGNIFPYTQTEFKTLPLEEINERLTFNPNKLEKALHEYNPSIFYHNSPQNPTGKVFSLEESRVIAELCKRYGAIIVSDEPYNEIIFDDKIHTSMLEFDNPETISVFSFSKSFAATGFRIGFAVSRDKEAIRKMAKGQYTECAGVATSFQYGFAKGLNEKEKRNKWFGELINGLKERRDVAYRGLKEIFPELQQAEGAFYLFPNLNPHIPGRMDEKRLLELCLDRGVAIVPGSSFGKEFEGYMRISYSATNVNQIKEGTTKIYEVIEDLKKQLK